jgi:hypothetical protein
MSPNSCLNSFHRLGDPVMDWECCISGSSSFLLCPCLTDGPHGPGGRCVPCVFIACSSCSCSASLSIRGVFEFWLGEVSDGPRVPGGQSAGAWQTVHVLPADGPLFAVRLWRFCCLFRTVRVSGRTVYGKGADSPRYPAGQSARPLRTVRPAWPDSPPEPGSFVLWFDSSLLLSCFRVRFKESFLRLEVDP